MSWLEADDPQAMKVFDTIIQKRCAVEPGEHVLIVADMATDERTIRALVPAVARAGAIPTIVIQPNAGWGEDPHQLTLPVQKAYPAADLVIAATCSSSASVYGRPPEFRSLMERKEKVRVFSMCERPFEIIASDTTDYDRVDEKCAKIMDIITQGKELRIKSRLGTDLVVDISEIPYASGFPMDCYRQGRSVEPGDFGGVGDGEVHFGPPYHTIEGSVVIDGPIDSVSMGDPDEPIRILVRKGRIVSIDGGRTAKKLRDFITKIKGDYISEIAIGTNPDWIPSQHSPHSVKKGLGNCHVAYGGWLGHQDEASIIKDRGKARANEAIPCKIHGDMVIYKATVIIDGNTIMEDNKLNV